jgi:hypothetical protein
MPIKSLFATAGIEEDKALACKLYLNTGAVPKPVKAK